MAAAKIFVLGSFVAACTVTVDALPKAGESLAGGAFALEPGGKGMNLAIAARRLGASVDGLFCVGDDMFGALAEQAFGRADLSVSMLRRKPGATGGGVGFIGPGGETCLAVASGANYALGADDVGREATAIAAADICLAQFEIADEPVREAFAIARRAGRLTLLNPSPFRMPDAATLASTSVLCVNAHEAAAMAGRLGVDADPAGRGFESVAEAVFARGVEALVVTAGAEGAVAYRRGVLVCAQPAFPVTALDTLGAGDAFAAGLAVSLAEGLDWETALRRAAAAGGLAATVAGTFDAMPTRAAVDELIAAHG